jgi:hypothetical protein
MEGFMPFRSVRPVAILFSSLCAAGTVLGAGPTYHVGASLGLTETNSDCAGATKCDRSDTGARAWVTWLAPSGLGVEASYHRFGGTYVTTTSGTTPVAGRSSLQGFGIGAVGTLREGNWSGHVRFGIGRYRNELKVSALGVSDSFKDSDTQPYYGIGISYHPRQYAGWSVIGSIDGTTAKNRSQASYSHRVLMVSVGVQRQL